MKTEGKVLTKKQRNKIKMSKKFKEIKIGSATLCNPVKQKRCKFSDEYPYNIYCGVFEKELEYTKNRYIKRLPECKEAFGKQMIITGRE